MTLLIHKSNNTEDLFLKVGTIPEPISREYVELKNLLTIIKHLRDGGHMYKWKKNPIRCIEVSKDTTTGVHCMYTVEKTGAKHQK